MKVKNVGSRPVWYKDVIIYPGETKEIPATKEEISGLSLVILDYESDYEKLIKIKGIDKEIAKLLLDNFGTIENIKKVGASELAKLPAIGKKRAEIIVRSLEGDEEGGQIPER